MMNYATRALYLTPRLGSYSNRIACRNMGLNMNMSMASVVNGAWSNFARSLRFRIQGEGSMLNSMSMSVIPMQPVISIPSLLDGLVNRAILYIKRTFQPSLVKRKRKHGFLKRKKSVGGRRVLNRRMRKNRKRLAC